MINNEINRKVAADFFEQIWNQKDESAIDRFIALHAAGNDPEFGVGRESFREQWKQWHASFLDLHFEVKEIIVRVIAWSHVGTSPELTQAQIFKATQHQEQKLQLMG